MDVKFEPQTQPISFITQFGLVQKSYNIQLIIPSQKSESFPGDMEKKIE